MREMTASDVSRSFSAVLDSAENGETVVVTRAGRRIAAITPAPQTNGAALRAVFKRWSGDSALDDTLAARVAAARGTVSAELDTDPWRD